MNLKKSITHPNASANLIVVMGIAGSGKSTLSNLLASQHGYTYLDADDFHSQSSKDMMSQGIPLTDAERGPWVASICEELKRHLERNSSVVLAFSGLRKKHRDLIRQVGLKTLFLFLSGSKATIYDRVNSRKGHYMSASMVDSQLASLEDPSAEPDVFHIDIEVDLPSVSSQAATILSEQLNFTSVPSKMQQR